MDVAKVAQSLGGGGHARAAGFRQTGTLDEVKKAAIAAIEGALA